MNYRIFVLLAGCAALLNHGAEAATVTGTFDPSFPLYTKYDPSIGFDDWVAFGFDGTANSKAYKAAGPASFSDLSEILGADKGVGGLNGKIKLQWTDGVSPVSFDADATYAFCQQTSSFGHGVSFTMTMTGETQELYVMALSLQSNANLSAVLSSNETPTASFELFDQVLPVRAFEGDNTSFGFLKLTISGATPGDVLTFTNSTNYGTIPGGGQNYSAVGISFAQTRVIPTPEPSSMLLLGLGGLAFCRRIRQGRESGSDEKKEG